MFGYRGVLFGYRGVLFGYRGVLFGYRGTKSFGYWGVLFGYRGIGMFGYRGKNTLMTEQQFLFGYQIYLDNRHSVIEVLLY